MRILLSNDDGIQCPNLHLLYAALVEAGHEVRTVAPATQHSGAGSSITVHSPLLTKKVILPNAAGGPFEGIAVSGSPADCVILGLHGLLPDFTPELVISGINLGPNAGMDVFFSGTIGAAVQGAMNGIPSLAVSHAGYGTTDQGHAKYVVQLADRIDWKTLPARRVYNLNIPDCPAAEIKGLKICPQSTDWAFLQGYDKRTAPNGTEYYWIKDPFEHFRIEDEGFDKSWIHDGWATLTPLKLDLTDHTLLKTLEDALSGD